jgi:hypothetical protein
MKIDIEGTEMQIKIQGEIAVYTEKKEGVWTREICELVDIAHDQYDTYLAVVKPDGSFCKVELDDCFVPGSKADLKMQKKIKAKKSKKPRIGCNPTRPKKKPKKKSEPKKSKPGRYDSYPSSFSGNSMNSVAGREAYEHAVFLREKAEKSGHPHDIERARKAEEYDRRINNA